MWRGKEPAGTPAVRVRVLGSTLKIWSRCRRFDNFVRLILSICFLWGDF